MAFQQITLSASSPAELQKRIEDNIRRGWEFVKQGEDLKSVSRWDWQESRKTRKYCGRDLYTKHIAVMRRKKRGQGN